MFQQLLQPSESHGFSCRGIIRDPGVGAVRLPDRGPSDITGSLGEKAETSRSADPRRDLELYARALSRQSQGRRRGAAIRQGACAPPGRSRRRSPCSSRRRSPIPATRRCSPAMAGRWRTTAISSRRSTSSAAPIAPDRSGLADPVGARRGARSARPLRGSAAVLCSALKIAPEEPSVLSNLGLSYVLSKDLPKAEETLRRANSRAGCRSARARESGAGGRPAGPHRRGRKDREGRPAARGSGGECRRSQAVAVAQGECARAQMDKMPVAAAGRSD